MRFEPSASTAPEAGERSDRAGSRFLGLGVVASFAVLYLYNAIRSDRDTLRGDQWVWVRDVLVPFEQGRLSLFDAVTTEYATMSHSHIPTLSVFLANANLFGLDLTVDVIVGLLSLVAVTMIVHRHAERLGGVDPWLVTGAASSLVFLSSSYGNFAWSLLQLQMFYVLVATLYLYRFARQVENPTPVHALVVVPATLALGDAIGVAAVVSSLVYLVLLTAVRRVALKQAALHLLVFPVHLYVLGELLSGTRAHGEIPWRTFLDIVRDQPADILRAGSEALAGGLFGFHDEGLLSWDWGWLGLAATLILLAAAGIGLRRGRLESHDHFPLMLILASVIWSAGVLRSRFWLGGVEVMRTPRFVPYTTLLGLGVILLVAGKWRVLRRWRYAVGATLAVVVAVNAIGSLLVSVDGDGKRQQDLELTSLREYVEGSVDVPILAGLQCHFTTPCLEAAWFLWDEGLGPFAGSPSNAPDWVVDLRAAVFAELRDVDLVEHPAECSTLSATTDDELLDRLGPHRALVPPDRRSEIEAVEIFRRAITVECLAFE